MELTITVPDHLATAADDHGIDLAQVALDAIDASVENAVVAAARETANAAARDAITALREAPAETQGRLKR